VLPPLFFSLSRKLTESFREELTNLGSSMRLFSPAWGARVPANPESFSFLTLPRRFSLLGDGIGEADIQLPGPKNRNVYGRLLSFFLFFFFPGLEESCPRPTSVNPWVQARRRRKEDFFFLPFWRREKKQWRGKFSPFLFPGDFPLSLFHVISR